MKRLCGDSWKALLADTDAFIFDADGVLWNGPDAIPGSADAVQALLNAGKRVFMATNNSTKSRATYEAKAAKLGFKGFAVPNIVTTSAVAARHVAGLAIKGRAYVIGSKGVGDELDAVGVKHFGIGPDPVDPNESDAQDMLTSVPLESDVGCVVCGFDGHISYRKLMKAASYLKDPAVPFVVTNTDPTVPSANPTYVIPGTGSMVAMVREGSGRQGTVMGKPEAPMWEYIRGLAGEAGLEPKRTLMVGDRCGTDIAFGNRNALRTLLVLSGDTSEEMVRGYEKDGKPELVPTFFTPTLGDISQWT